MLSKISNEEIIKGYIIDYSKTKDYFKQMLRHEGFRWMKIWERQNTYGKEGVWLNPITKLSIRIRWGIVYPTAIVYAEKEMEEVITKFLYRYEFTVMSSPNEDYDILNKGVSMKETD